MKKNKRTMFLAVTALVLTMSIGIGSAMAYFTTYVTAKGGVSIDLGFTQTFPEENVVDGKKEIIITNTGDYDCYVRLKAFTGDAYKESIVYSEPENAGKWIPGDDGYYYYNAVVSAKGSTSQINVGFAFPTEKPADFNVIIIQECAPVLYKADGTPYADWNTKAEVSQSVYK